MRSIKRLPIRRDTAQSQQLRQIANIGRLEGAHLQCDYGYRINSTTKRKP